MYDSEIVEYVAVGFEVVAVHDDGSETVPIICQTIEHAEKTANDLNRAIVAND